MHKTVVVEVVRGEFRGRDLRVLLKAVRLEERPEGWYWAEAQLDNPQPVDPEWVGPYIFEDEAIDEVERHLGGRVLEG